jgi:hypothetical protein
MIPTDIEISIGADRLATWNEVHSALLFSTKAEFQLVGALGDFAGMNSDYSDGPQTFPEEGVWLALVNAMAASPSN